MLKFEQTYEKIIECCNKKLILEAFKVIQEEWRMLENPKPLDGLLDAVVGHCLKVCEEFKTYKVANQIGQLTFCNNVLTIKDIGIEEAALAKVVYAQGNLEVAKQLFLIANKLSNGVELRAEIYKKYRELIKDKVIIDKSQSLRGRLIFHLAQLNNNELDKNKICAEFEDVLNKWEKLSEPKIMKAKAYQLVKEFILLCIKYQLYDLGNECIGLLLSRVTQHDDDGEREYIAGELAYEQQNFAVAQIHFWVANQKSKGRCFNKAKDEIYKELIEKGWLELEFDSEIYDIYEKLDLVPKNLRIEIQEDNDEELTELPPELYKKISSLYDEGDQLTGDDAIEKFQQALDLLPGNIEDWEISKLLYSAIGDEYISKKDYEEALNYFRYAFECDGLDNPYILFNLGLCMYELGDKEQATEYFVRAYMVDGQTIFNDYDLKYFALIKHIVL